MATSLKSQTHVSLQIDASDVVDYIVTNPEGRRSGIDPRVVDQSGKPILLDEISHAGYGYMSVGNRDPKGDVSVTAEFTAGFSSPQGDGIFRIDLIGLKTAKFDLYLNLSSDDTTRAQDADFSILQVPIDKDSVLTYLFTYHGALDSPVSLIRQISSKK